MYLVVILNTVWILAEDRHLVRLLRLLYRLLRLLYDTRSPGPQDAETTGTPECTGTPASFNVQRSTFNFRRICNGICVLFSNFFLFIIPQTQAVCFTAYPSRVLECLSRMHVHFPTKDPHPLYGSSAPPFSIFYVSRI